MKMYMCLGEDKKNKKYSVKQPVNKSNYMSMHQPPKIVQNSFFSGSIVFNIHNLKPGCGHCG
jgi:hypothetical protein